MRITILLLFFSISVFSQTFEESVLSVASLPDSVQVDSMIKLSRINAINNNPELGVEQARWGLNEAKSNNLKHHVPFARFYLARNYSLANKKDSALVNYLLALEEINGTRYNVWRIYILSAIGNNYRQRGDFKNAIEIQLNAIEKYRDQLDSNATAELNTEIGYSYDRMKDFNKALTYHRKAIQLLPPQYPAYKNFILGRIAIAHDDLGNFDSAHYYNFRVLSYEVSHGDSAGVGMTSSNIGNTFLKEKKWIKAEQFLKRSCRLNLIHGDDGNKSIAHINLGNVNIELKKFSAGRDALNKGVQFAKAWKHPKFLSEAYFLKSRLFEKSGELDSSLFYFKEYKVLEDSLYNLDKLAQIKEISTRYEIEKKEQKIEIQNASLAEKESELKANQRTIVALIVFVLLILVVAFGAYKRYQAKRNAELQQKIIEEQERGLKAVFNAQEEERKRISRDLHDGVGQQLSGLKMAFQQLGKSLESIVPEKKEEVNVLAKIVSDSADEVRSISHQMMPRALTELGLLDALKDMLQKSLGLSSIHYTFEHFGIDERLKENIEISLYRVCQELMNNIIKHSNAKTVNVQLYKNSDKVILIVEDDGKGISASNTDGHGLLNMKSRINTLNGEVNLEPSPQSGTLATIRIPI